MDINGFILSFTRVNFSDEHMDLRILDRHGAYYAIVGIVTLIGIAIGVYYKLYSNKTIAQNNNLFNISGPDLNKISKFKIKMDNDKTLKNCYSHTLAGFAGKAHEKNLALAELFGHSELIQKRFNLKKVILILLTITIVLMCFM